ncbi:polycomb group protein EMBRYONIC FLOWER 2 isoform X2 [Mercurialis annua]|uniref:polycomb group protein EMBRYONIC FLOWER 2 isoform X2 n=1 Tax=Mercurialis annua TaxID=3986 RepID=UPI00215FEEE3|nr:polycomb group protein EMBRYONIC FLOWER 2 isoform X2 [Mercurialis annua]
MPGIPLVARETSSYTRNTEQMCREDARLHLSEEEEMAAEESLSIYCKPVELYNILQRRAIRNPSFLQRSLSYKIQAKHKRRIQVSISLFETVNGALSGSLYPLYILLARAVSDIRVSEYSAVYRFHRACVLTNFFGVEGSTQANFVLPEINKLALEAKSGSLVILFVSFAGAQNSMHGVDLTKGHLENVGGCCLLGTLPLDSLCMSWEKSPNLTLGQRVELTSQIKMKSCFLKLSCLNEEKSLSVQFPFSTETTSSSQCLQANVSAEEVGAKEKSPYHSYTFSGISSSSLSHIIRLRAGNVIFNYRYYNNKLQKTEVTEEFSCPFCLVKCGSFKVTEEFQAVNISVKTDTWRSEIVADGVDPKQQTFDFCSKKPRRNRRKNLVHNSKHVQPLVHDSNLRIGASSILDKADGGKGLLHSTAGATACAEHVPSSFDVAGVSEAFSDPECVQVAASGNNFAPPAMLQFAKTRKLSVERSDLRNRTLLHKRQFFHSHRAQPMDIEQVLSDRDSEDEVDDDVADFEDRRMLDDFVDVTKDEKQIMHLWNSFVRKQRVLADGHIPWACEGFSRLHGHDLVRAPALLWCWRLLMIKLWNHGLLDARTMNNCNISLEQYQKQDIDPMKS